MPLRLFALIAVLFLAAVAIAPASALAASSRTHAKSPAAPAATTPAQPEPEPAAPRPQPQGIAAIVNEDIISVLDLEKRISLFIATSNTQDSPEARKRLAPEVLRSLIDETLKRQEMRHRDITVPQADIDRALTQIAAQLNVPPTELDTYLAMRGVQMPTLIEQVEAEIGWLRVVSKIAGDRGAVSGEEVDAEMDAAARHPKGTEYRLGEIFLAVDSPEDQPKVEQRAIELTTQARQGANFAVLARTFSQGPSSESGGDLGWVGHDDLDPKMAQVVGQMQPGQISDPLRGQGGYFILYLAGRRSGAEAASMMKTVVTLQQMLLPLSADAPEAEVNAKARVVRDITAGVTSCDDFAARGQRAGVARSGRIDDVDIQQLSPELRQLIQPMKPGEVAVPVRVVEGFILFMLCDRQTQDATTDTRQAVERRLRDQRLSAVSRRELRELRRSALLDIRL